MTAVACEVPRRDPGDVEDPSAAGGRRGMRRYPTRSTVRIRLLDAMVDLAREVGRDRVSTSRLYRHAGVGRRVFESEFASIEECFEEAVEVALGHLLARVSDAIDGAGPEWADRVSAAVVGFLRFLDEQPARAWMAIVEPLGGGDRARFARRSALERLGALIADGPRDAVDVERPHPRTAPDVVGGLWEMARQYLWDGPQAVDLDAVAGSTIFLALSPYLGRRDAMLRATAAPRIAGSGVAEPGPAEARAADGGATAALSGLHPGIAGPGPARTAGRDPLAMLPVLTALAAETLIYLERRPEASGVDVSAAIRVAHPSQTSRHLRRLEQLDLVRSERDGRFKRWTLTDRGAAVVERLRDR